MSGGSMDYLYSRVEDASFAETTALRRAFRDHLVLVAAALRSIEWNDSSDGDDKEDANIRACLAPGAELTRAAADVRRAIAEAETVLARTEAPRA